MWDMRLIDAVTVWPAGAPVPAPAVLPAANRVVVAYYSAAGLMLAGLDAGDGSVAWRRVAQAAAPAADSPVATCGGLLVLKSAPQLVAVSLTGYPYAGALGPNSSVWTWNAADGGLVWSAPYVCIPGKVTPTLLGVMSAPVSNGTHVFVAYEASDAPPRSDARVRMLLVCEATGVFAWYGAGHGVGVGGAGLAPAVGAAPLRLPAPGGGPGELFVTLDATGMFSGFAGGVCLWQRDIGVPVSAAVGTNTRVLPSIAAELSSDGSRLELWAALFLPGASPDASGAYVVHVSVVDPFSPAAAAGDAAAARVGATLMAFPLAPGVTAVAGVALVTPGSVVVTAASGGAGVAVGVRAVSGPSAYARGGVGVVRSCACSRVRRCVHGCGCQCVVRRVHERGGLRVGRRIAQLRARRVPRRRCGAHHARVAVRGGARSQRAEPRVVGGRARDCRLRHPRCGRGRVLVPPPLAAREAGAGPRRGWGSRH